MKRLRHIAFFVVATAMAAVVCGCNSRDDDFVTESPDDLVTLVLNVGLVSPTRAEADNDRERMHSLRILLLKEYEKDSYEVEYNEHIPYGGSGLISDYKIISTTPGKKKLFLVANEESIASVQGVSGFSGSLTTLLDGLDVGERGAVDRIQSIWYTPGTYDGNIPLSSSYEFMIDETVSSSDNNRQVEKTFYLVHAATKFEFTFVNNRQSWVRVDNLSISSVAQNMYLMAHLDESELYKTGPDGGTYYWIDWLKSVSDATTANPSDPANTDINARYGWIRDYAVPNSSRIMNVSIDNNLKTIPARESRTLPVVYCPESKNLGPGQNEQQYTLGLTLAEQGKSTTFTNLVLENVKALFRNTHVKITVVMRQDSTIQLSVTICPWDEKSTVIHFD